MHPCFVMMIITASDALDSWGLSMLPIGCIGNLFIQHLAFTEKLQSTEIALAASFHMHDTILIATSRIRVLRTKVARRMWRKISSYQCVRKAVPPHATIQSHATANIRKQD